MLTMLNFHGMQIAARARAVIIAFFACGPFSESRARNYGCALHAALCGGFADDGTATALGCQIKNWEKFKAYLLNSN